jgi:flagellar biosynthesis protein FlhA
MKMGKKEKAEEDAAVRAAEEKKTREAAGDMSPVVPLDPLSLEVGYGLIPLVDKDKGADLLSRVQHLRRESAMELGLVIPAVHIVDNIRLDPSEYCIKINGVEVGRAKVRVGMYLCIVPSGTKTDIPGEKTRDPSFGLPAVWITDEYRDQAEREGLTVVDGPSIIATHFGEIIKAHADEILGREETSKMIEELRKKSPAVVADAEKALSQGRQDVPVLGEIQKVLQNLLHEQVSIRNLSAILESIADYAPLSRDVQLLTEKARQKLGRQICLQYADENRTLHVLLLDKDLENTLVSKVVTDPILGKISALDTGTHVKWINALSKVKIGLQNQGLGPLVILCASEARALVKQSCERDLPETIVLSSQEIVQDVNIKAEGVIKID